MQILDPLTGEPGAHPVGTGVVVRLERARLEQQLVVRWWSSWCRCRAR